MYKQELLLLELYLKEKIDYHNFMSYFEGKSYNDFVKEDIDLIINSIPKDEVIFLGDELFDLPSDAVNKIIEIECETENPGEFALANFGLKHLNKLTEQSIEEIVRVIVESQNVFTPYKVECIKKFLDALPYCALEAYAKILSKVQDIKGLINELLEKGNSFESITESSLKIGDGTTLLKIYETYDEQAIKELAFNKLLILGDGDILKKLAKNSDKKTTNKIIDALTELEDYSSLLQLMDEKLLVSEGEIANKIYSKASHKDLVTIHKVYNKCKYISYEYLEEIFNDTINELHELRTEQENELIIEDYNKYYDIKKERYKILSILIDLCSKIEGFKVSELTNITINSKLPNLMYMLATTVKGVNLKVIEKSFKEQINAELLCINSWNEEIVAEELDEYAMALVRYLRKIETKRSEKLILLLLRVNERKYLSELLKNSGVLDKDIIIDTVVFSSDDKLMLKIINELDLPLNEERKILEHVKEINKIHSFKSELIANQLERIVDYNKICEEALEVGLIKAFDDNQISFHAINKKTVLDYMIFKIDYFIDLLSVYYEFLTSNLSDEEVMALDTEYLNLKGEKLKRIKNI